MQEQTEGRFEGVMDHIAVESKDLERDVREYERIGFHLETLYQDWAMLRDGRGFGVALLAIGRATEPDKPYTGRFELERIVFKERYGDAWPDKE